MGLLELSEIVGEIGPCTRNVPYDARRLAVCSMLRPVSWLRWNRHLGIRSYLQ